MYKTARGRRPEESCFTDVTRPKKIFTLGKISGLLKFRIWDFLADSHLQTTKIFLYHSRIWSGFYQSNNFQPVSKSRQKLWWNHQVRKSIEVNFDKVEHNKNSILKIVQDFSGDYEPFYQLQIRILFKLNSRKNNWRNKKDLCKNYLLVKNFFWNG